MTLKETVTHFLSHFPPLTLVKQVFPVQTTSSALTQLTHEQKPWVNANIADVDLIMEDIA